MRNLTHEINRLLSPAPTRRLSRVLSRIGTDLYSAADIVSDARQSVSGSGLNVGDYILHEGPRVFTNLGQVEVTTVAY